MRLKDYVMIAAGADLEYGIPCFHLDPKRWSKHLADNNRKCLVDETLKNALAAGVPEAGITQWQDRGPDVVFNVLEHYGYNNKNTLVLRLSPEGILLSSEKLCRRHPHDIFKHPHEQSSSSLAVRRKRVRNSHHQVKQSDPKSTMLCLEYLKSPTTLASEKLSERNLTHTSKRVRNSHRQVKESGPKSTMLCPKYSKSPTTSASEKLSKRNLTHTSPCIWY